MTSAVPVWSIANIDTMKAPALEAMLAEMAATGHGTSVISGSRRTRKLLIATIRTAREAYWTTRAADQARIDAAAVTERRDRGRAPSAAQGTITAAEVDAWLRTLPRMPLAGADIRRSP